MLRRFILKLDALSVYECLANLRFFLICATHIGRFDAADKGQDFDKAIKDVKKEKND